MTQLYSPTKLRTIAATAAVLLLALTVVTGTVAAHNPACKQPGGSDGPHYDDDETTGSDTAYDKNKNLGGDAPNDNAADSCEKGNSQSSDGDH